MKAVALLMLLPVAAAAQTTSLGPSLTFMASNDGTDIGRCTNPPHFGALGLQATRPISGRTVALQLSVRGFWLQVPFRCMETLMAPPPLADGTHDIEHHLYLQDHSFITTDARLAFTTPRNIALLSGGAGMAWREGRDVPYVIAGIGIPANRRFGLQIEYSWLRLTNARVRETWQGGQQVSQQSLGTVTRWQGAVTFGIRWALPL